MSDGATGRLSDSMAPLKGVRVLDLTIFWAGPLPTAILADLGAEVIKIEAIQRLDPFRAYGMSGTDIQSQERPHERSPLFNTANRNKRGITLNLASEDGRRLFKALVAKSQVLLTNLSPRVLPQLGLGYEVLREINPALVVTSVSGFSLTGPWREYVSMAVIGEALSGISSLTGYTGEGPMMHGVGVSDPFAGLNAAFATLAALHYARATGRGQLVDVSQLESSVPFIADAFMDFSLNGRCRTRNTNEDPGRAPHGAFPAKGEDGWITISVGTQEEWEALVGVMGQPEWARDPRFATPLERHRNRHALHTFISEWTREQDKERLTQELQAQGVPAAPVRTPAEQLEDPHLRATGFFQYVDHPYVGRQPYPSLPVRLNGSYPPIHRVGPLLGEDNRYVFKEILGLDDDELGRLEREGVIGTEPAFQ